VFAATVFGMQHQHHIEQMRCQLGPVSCVQQVEEVLSVAVISFWLQKFSDNFFLLPAGA